MGHIRRNTAKIATVAEARSRKRATYEERAEMPPEQRQNPASEPFWKNDEKSSRWLVGAGPNLRPAGTCVTARHAEPPIRAFARADLGRAGPS
jgi:hypothetical protein